MARLPYVDPASASPEVREALEVLPPLNIFRTVAHADTAVRAILGQGELDPRRRELAILRTAAVTGAEYEWIQHESIARGVGASDDQIAAVKAGDLEAEAFDDDDRLVLRCTEELLRNDAIGEATFASARERLSDREILELILAVGYYRMLAGVMNSVAIDLAARRGAGVVEPARRRNR